jgi:hypothetical protein
MQSRLINEECLSTTVSELWCTNSVKNVKSEYEPGFEVLTAVALKTSVFWYIRICRPVKINQHFRGIYHLPECGSNISSESSVDFHRITQCLSQRTEFFKYEFFHLNNWTQNIACIGTY